ncbi:MAG: N-acetylmuramoyl-L-alanine amidase [Myxococcota bacterium]
MPARLNHPKFSPLRTRVSPHARFHASVSRSRHILSPLGMSLLSVLSVTSSLQAATPDFPDASWQPACASNVSQSSRGASDITQVIVHETGGSFSQALSTYQSCSSADAVHYLVAEGGGIVQLVEEVDIVTHTNVATADNASVQVELEGLAGQGDTPEATYYAAAALIRNICERQGIPMTRAYLLGADEISGSGQADPGVGFDWDYLLYLIEADVDASLPTSGTLAGVVRAYDPLTGPALEGAKVQLSTGASTFTDAGGAYHFSNVAPGAVTVTASLSCYESETVNTSVIAGTEAWANLGLDEPTYSDSNPIPPECEGGEGDGTGDGSCRWMGPALPGPGFHVASVVGASPEGSALKLSVLVLLALGYMRRRRGC